MSFDQGGTHLGTAYGRVIIDASGVQQGMQEARSAVQNGFSQIGSSIQRAGASITNLGTQWALAAAPMTAFGVLGINTARKFDNAMSMIQARTGLVGDDLKQVEQLALDMGAATVYSSTDAANAMLQMLTAGLSVEESMSALPNVLNMAAASGESLAMAADLTTNIMSSFGMTAEDTTQIVEAMSRAAASSPASMGEMGIALQRIGGLATGMGIGLNEASAALVLMAQAGIRGEEAATQFKSMLISMQKDTPGVVAAWDALGTSLYDLEGNARPLNDVFEDIKKGLEGMTQQEQNAVIKELAGSYGLTAMNAILAGDSIEDVIGIMESQASAQDIANARMQTFQGSITSLAGSFETLQIAIFRPFMNAVLKPIVDWLIVATNAVTSFVNANSGLMEILLPIFAIFAAGGPILLTIGNLLKMVGFLFSGIGVTLSLIFSPLTLIIGAVGLLYLAFKPLIEVLKTAYNVFKLFRGLGASVEDSLKVALRTFMSEEDAQRIIDFIQAISDAFHSVLTVIRQSALAIGKWLIGAFEDVIDWIQEAAVWLGEFLGKGIEWVKEFGSAVGEWLVGAFEKVKDLLAPLNRAFYVFQFMLSRTGDVMMSLRFALTSLFGGTTARRIIGVLDAIRDSVAGLIRGFKELAGFIIAPFKAAYDVLKGGGGLGEALEAFGETALESLKNLGKWFSAIVKHVLPVVRDTLSSIFGNLWKMIFGNSSSDDVLGFLEESISDIGDFLVDKFSELGNWFMSSGALDFIIAIPRYIGQMMARYLPVLGQMVGQALRYILRYAIPAIAGFVAWLAQALPGILQGLAGFLWEVLQGAAQGIIEGLGIIWDIIKPAVVDGLNKLNEWFSSGQALVDLSGVGLMILDRIMQGVYAIIGIGQMIGDWIASTIKGIDWGQAASDFIAFGGKVVGWVIDGIADIGQKIISWISEKLAGVNWSKAKDDFVSFGSDIIDWIIEGLGDLSTTINDEVITPLVDEFKNIDWESVKNTLFDFGSSILSKIGEGLGSVADWINTNLIEPLKGAVGDALGSAVAGDFVVRWAMIAVGLGLAFNAIKTVVLATKSALLGFQAAQAGTSLLTTLTAPIISGFATVWGLVETAILAVKTAFLAVNWPLTLLIGAIALLVTLLTSGDGIIPNLKKWGTTLMQLVAIPLLLVGLLIKKVIDFLGELGKLIKDNALPILKDAGTTLLQLVLIPFLLVGLAIKKVVDFIGDVINKLSEFFDDIGVIDLIKDAFEAGFGAIETVVGGVVKIITGIVGALGDVYNAAMKLLGIKGSGGKTYEAPPGYFEQTPEQGAQAAVDYFNQKFGGSGASGIAWTGSGGENEPAGIWQLHKGETLLPQEGMLTPEGLRVFPSPTGPIIPGLGEMLAAMAQSMATPAAMVPAAASGGGGGDTYNTFNFEVPLEILRDEPHLAQNARTFADGFMERYRGQS